MKKKKKEGKKNGRAIMAGKRKTEFTFNSAVARVPVRPVDKAGPVCPGFVRVLCQDTDNDCVTTVWRFHKSA